jgi:large subunit ribosomal protein L13
MTEYTIDATNKKLGRVATEAAMILMGKNDPDYAPNVVAKNKVTITNASKIDLSPKKLKEEYARYSGYPGGLRFEQRGKKIDRLGFAPIFEHAVRGMLQKNRLQDKMMKNLTITE